MAVMKLGAADRHQLAVDTENGRGWFCLSGVRSGELLTHEGRLIVHHDQRELQFLLCGDGGDQVATVVPVPDSARQGPFLPVSAHPMFRDVQSWDPINPKEFHT